MKLLNPFQSSHPGWGGTSGSQVPDHQHGISILPPWVGWDQKTRKAGFISENFNPPTLGGVGLKRGCVVDAPLIFQSSHPGWGGTLFPDHRRRAAEFQSSHPGWGGTAPRWAYRGVCRISILPPWVGWDSPDAITPVSVSIFQSSHPGWGGTRTIANKARQTLFQSSHPGWGGTSHPHSLRLFALISILPPWVGWDFLIGPFQ